MNPTLLGIETATDTCSAALLVGERVLERSLSGGRRHDAALLGMIGDLLAEADIPRSALSAVAVSAGPGSYTGLRIGASVAKGIAEGLSIPLLAVPSLLACGLQAMDTVATPKGASLVLAAFPSRRHEVYAALVDVSGPYPSQLGVSMAGMPDVILRELEGQGTIVSAIVGPGADRFESANVVPEVSTCSAGAVARLGAQMLAEGRAVDVELFEPYYLKDFIAGIPTKSVFARLPF
ncbi:MAG: tRNA threonylcarbamoyladenosine biosynthesis protein TsaB [Rhodothermales bacterium]